MQKGKKLFSAVFAAAFVFCSVFFSSCSVKEEPQSTDKNGEMSSASVTDESRLVSTGESDENDGENSDKPVFKLIADKTEVSPGEDITVTIRLSNAPLTACFKYILTYSDTLLTYKAYETAKLGDMQFLDSSGDGIFVLAGMVASTVDIIDNELAAVTFKVAEDAPAGETIEIKGRVDEFQKGQDADGAVVDDILGIADDVLTLTVK